MPVLQTAVKSDTVNIQLILWRFFDTKMIQFGDILILVYNNKRGDQGLCGRFLLRKMMKPSPI